MPSWASPKDPTGVWTALACKPRCGTASGSFAGISTSPRSHPTRPVNGARRDDPGHRRDRTRGQRTGRPACVTAGLGFGNHTRHSAVDPVGSAPRPTHDIALAAAAERAGVSHVVKLSVLDGGASDDPIGAWHRQAEAAVTDGGFDWTLLRPGRFASNALQWVPMIRRGDMVAIPFGTWPAAPIDPADVAAVAVAAFMSDRHRGAAYRLSGPQVLTPEDELRILGENLGRSLRFVEPPAAAARAQMIKYGMPEPVADAVIARVLSDDGSGAEVLPTVASILSRPPATFAHWAKAHTGLFTRPAADE